MADVCMIKIKHVNSHLKNLWSVFDNLTIRHCMRYEMRYFINPSHAMLSVTLNIKKQFFFCSHKRGSIFSCGNFGTSKIVVAVEVWLQNYNIFAVRRSNSFVTTDYCASGPLAEFLATLTLIDMFPGLFQRQRSSHSRAKWYATWRWKVACQHDSCSVQEG